MRTAAGLAALAAGAILTFAVSAHVPGINLRLTGLIIMLAGIAGMIAPQRAAAWMHRSGGAGGKLGEPDIHPDEADDLSYSAYLLQDPAVLAAEVLKGARAAQPSITHLRPGQRSDGSTGQEGQNGQNG